MRTRRENRLTARGSLHAAHWQKLAHEATVAGNDGFGQHVSPLEHVPPSAPSSRQSAQRPDTPWMRA